METRQELTNMRMEMYAYALGFSKKPHYGTVLNMINTYFEDNRVRDAFGDMRHLRTKMRRILKGARSVTAQISRSLIVKPEQPVSVSDIATYFKYIGYSV